MRERAWAWPAILACALVSGCSSLWREEVELDGVQFLDSDAAAAPPSGLTRLCVEAPDICAPLQDDAPDSGVTQAALKINLNAPTPRPQIAFSREMWDLVVRVNADVNWLIAPRTDEEIYDRREEWALPLSRPDLWSRRGGDCEDYALEKRARLIAAGLSSGALQMAIGVSPSTGRHTVLIVRTDRGDIVLDNLSTMPLPLGAAPYRWVARQDGPRLLDWVLIQQPPAYFAPPSAIWPQTPHSGAPDARPRPTLLAAFEPVSGHSSEALQP